MSTTRKRPEPMVPFAFRARPSLIEEYRRIAQREERTLGSALRHHISEVVRAEQEKQAA